MNKKIELQLQSGERTLIDLRIFLEAVAYADDKKIHFKNDYEWTAEQFNIVPLVELWRKYAGTLSEN